MKFVQYQIAPEIKKSLAKLGFKKPTDIQFKSITPILKGEDVLAIAQTGTGKTAAFAIPIINIIQEQKTTKRSDGIKCLVMVPTRELAIQIAEVFNTIGKYTKVKTITLYGGVSQEPQIEALKEGADILVTTPGRMFDLSSQGHLKLHRIEILVLDEADHMLDLGFIDDIRDLIKRLPKKRQTLFFSATIDHKIKKLAYSIISKAFRIQISPKDPVAKNVNHTVAFIEMDDKRYFLERIINENPTSKILVFVRTKVRAERVVKAMERVGITAISIHGGKEQSDRLEAMNQFKFGTVKILIATDVSARGIDIPNVDFVVNYDLPDVPENYVHRVGRTGRGVQKGDAIAFCSATEKPLLEAIENYTGTKISTLDVSKSDYKATIDFTNDTSNDWKKVMEDVENDLLFKRKKKKKKK